MAPEVMVELPESHPAATTLKRQGDSAYAARDFKPAVDFYSRALQLGEDAVIFSNRSAAYAQRRDFQSAAKDAEAAMRILPGWPRPYHRLGHALFHLGSYAEAVQTFRRGLELDPVDLPLSEALARAMQYTEVDDSASPLQPAEAAPALTAEELREKGNSCFRAGQHADAIRFYSEAIALNDKDSRSYANRAAAQMGLLTHESAATPERVRSSACYIAAMCDLDESLSIDPKYVKAYARKGHLLLSGGEPEEAMAAYERGLKIDPTSDDCLRGRGLCGERLRA